MALLLSHKNHCIFAFITIFKTVHGLAVILPDKQKPLFPGKISVFSSCSLCSIPSSGLLMACHIFYLHGRFPDTDHFLPAVFTGNFPTYITSSQTGHLGGNTMLDNPSFTKILSKNLSGSILTPFCPAYYKVFF